MTTQQDLDRKEMVELRHKLRWTQSALAENLGHSVSAVEHWEAGRRPVPKHVLQFLRQAAANDSQGDQSWMSDLQRAQTYGEILRLAETAEARGDVVKARQHRTSAEEFEATRMSRRAARMAACNYPTDTPVELVTPKSRAAFSGGGRASKFRIDADGAVSAWDGVAKYYTTCHSLTDGQCERLRMDALRMMEEG